MDEQVVSNPQTREAVMVRIASLIGLAQAHKLAIPGLTIEALAVFDEQHIVPAIIAPHNWLPIDQAPRDNLRPLYIAHFNDKGEMTCMDFNASWKYEQESWEMAHINYYYWESHDGNVEEPTHFAYMDKIMTENIHAVPASDTVFQVGTLHFSYGPRLVINEEVGPVPVDTEPNVWSLYAFSGVQSRWQHCRDFDTCEELMGYVNDIRLPMSGTEWQHRNGRKYWVLDRANPVSPGTSEYEATVVYRSANGSLYTRPLWDWHRSMTEQDPEEGARNYVQNFFEENSVHGYGQYIQKHLEGEFVSILARLLAEKGIGT